MTLHLQPREGCDRCWCGAKYWDGDRCVSCGDRFRPIVTGVTAPQGISHVVVPGGVVTVEKALGELAESHNGDVRDERVRDALTGSTQYIVTFTEEDNAIDFIDDVLATWPRLTAEEVV